MATMWKQAAGTALGILIGLVMGAMMYARAAPKQQTAPKVIRAQKFELVDTKGNVVASLEMSDVGNKELGIKGKSVGLILKSPNSAHITENSDTTQLPISGSITALMATDEGYSAIMMTGYKMSGADHKPTPFSNSALLGLMGNDGVPTLKLSVGADDKKVRIIKP